MEDIPLEVNRFGFMEETHFTIGYSAVPDPTAPSGIGGVLATVHEITQKVLGERRLSAVRELSTRSFEAKTVKGACDVAASTLAHCEPDVPFALIYLLDEKSETAYLACETGTGEFPALSAGTIDLSGPAELWPIASSQLQNKTILVEDLQAKVGTVAPGPWSDPPNSAAIVPIHSSVAGKPAGFLVAGISSRLRFDETYQVF
ncbi:MAG TPA: hypothetical protein VGI45_20515 [Terracidiphilus sp.]|jgi:hypothetical protein